MIPREGFLTALGTVLVTAAGVGLALGAHALFGGAVADPEPSVSVSASPTVEARSDFCAVIDDMAVAVKDDPLFSMENGTEPDPTPTESAAIMQAIHEQGQAIIDFTKKYADYETQASEIVNDPDVAAAFMSDAEAMTAMGDKFGQALLGAKSEEDFLGAFFLMGTDPEYAVWGEQSDAAQKIIGPYVLDECGVDLVALQNGTSGDTETTLPVTAAKADASTLGMEIATFFVDWSEGDALPEISVQSGTYYLSTTETKGTATTFSSSSIGQVSDGVDLVDQEINSPVDWCVSVAAAGSADATYRYTATGGMEPGTCADRANE